MSEKCVHELTEATGISPNHRNAEDLELQDALDIVPQIRPFAEVITELLQMHVNTQIALKTIDGRTQ